MVLCKATRTIRLDQMPDDRLRALARDTLGLLGQLVSSPGEIGQRAGELRRQLGDALEGTEATRFRFAFELDGLEQPLGPYRIQSHPGGLLEVAAALDLDDLYQLRRSFEGRTVAFVILHGRNGEALLRWRVQWNELEDLPIECDAQCEGPALERIVLHGCRYEAVL